MSKNRTPAASLETATDLPLVESRIASKTLDQLSSDGATIEPAKAYVGSVLEIAASDLKKYQEKPGVVTSLKNKYEESIADAVDNGGRLSPTAYRKMKELKRDLPDFSRAKEITVLKALHDDVANLEKAVEKPDHYIQLSLKDGTTQTGRVIDADGKPQRDGVWVSRNEKGEFLELAEFKEGQLHGNVKQYEHDARGNRRINATGYFQEGQAAKTHYRYNEEGLVTQRIKHDEDGKVVTNEPVDPEQTKAKQAEFQARREERSLERKIGPSW